MLKRPWDARDLERLKAPPKWTDEEVARLVALKAANESDAECARQLGRPFTGVSNKVQVLRARGLLSRPTVRADGRKLGSASKTPLDAAVAKIAHGKSWGESDGGAAATLSQVVFEPVRTLEDLLTICEVDAAVWSVESYTCNAWGGGTTAEPRTLYQVKAQLKRKSQVNSEVASGLLDGITARVRPLTPLKRTRTKSGYLYVATMGEPHIGKLAWAPETAEHYDLQIALDRVRQSHRHLMQRAAALSPERIALVIGDDFFNVDSQANTTTAGTPQDVDGRYRKVFRAGVALCREIIEGWRAIAPVTIWVKPGNHDTFTTWHVGEILAAIYEGSDVLVSNPDRLRSYQQWGTCLIGLTHGDKERDDKLPMLMAHEAKQEWAATTCRVWLTGHLHTLKAKTQRAVIRPMRSDVHEEAGVVIRRCRSLSGTDSWHHQMGYVGNVKAAEGFAFHRSMGETDIHTGAVAA